MLMDVIPLKPELVRGTHGRLPASSDAGPLFICSEKQYATENVDMLDVRDLSLQVMNK